LPELRKDYILDRWVIIASERARRPSDFKRNIEKKHQVLCHFCPGNEKYTPNEITRIEENRKWIIRCFSNKFPAVINKGNYKIETHNNFYTFSDGFGYHEIVVETNDKKKQLWDLPSQHIEKIFRIYLERINYLSDLEGINYVQVFKNYGEEAGTSVSHSHSQIIAYNKIPDIVEQEIKKNFINNKCNYCEIIQREKDSYRRCFENESFIAFCPYASRFPFEIWLFPKQHLTRLEECSLSDLSSILKSVLERLKQLNAPYNYMIHYSSKKEDKLHFHIEILPRLSTWAGFEFSGTVINSMPPEDAAKFYRTGNI